MVFVLTLVTVNIKISLYTTTKADGFNFRSDFISYIRKTKTTRIAVFIIRIKFYGDILI